MEMLPLLRNRTIPPAAMGVEQHPPFASPRKPRHKAQISQPLPQFPGSLLSSTLTPSTSRATFAIGDEQAARRVVDLLTESFFEGQAAIAAFVRSDGRWDVTVHFADPPDEDSIRGLVGLAAGDAVVASIAFDTVAAT